jgi:hypothetical protein
VDNVDGAAASQVAVAVLGVIVDVHNHVVGGRALDGIIDITVYTIQSHVGIVSSRDAASKDCRSGCLGKLRGHLCEPPG